MITQGITAVKSAQTKTCSQCPHFNNHLYSESKGWCELFNLPARSFHIQTHDCVLNSPVTTVNPESFLDDIFANYSPKELKALTEEAFPTEVIELDRDGYPMGEQTVENAYHNPNFVISPNAPF